MPCVLEYDADAQNGTPVCVPPATFLRSHRLSEREVVLMKQILVRLLPQIDSVALATAFDTLHVPLQAYIHIKIKNEVDEIPHSSWQESCRRIASTTMNEIDHSTCFSCMESVNDTSSTEVLHTMSCCGVIAHLACIQECGRHSNRCPLCRELLDHRVPGFVPLTSPPPSLQEQQLNQLQEQRLRDNPIFIMFTIIDLTMLVFLLTPLRRTTSFGRYLVADIQNDYLIQTIVALYKDLISCQALFSTRTS